MDDLGHRGKWHQASVLDAVLSSLCPAHSSLLHQMLKMAQRENLPSFLNRKPVGQTESYCACCGVNPQDSVGPLAVQISECKAHNHKPYYSLSDCDHQGHGSTFSHAEDSKSNCSVHHYPLKDCKSKASVGSRYFCVQRCRMETYTFLCPKRLHSISCQSLAGGQTNKVMCPFASSALLSTCSSLCSPSSTICCNQHNCHSCPCYSNHTCLMQVRNTKEIGFGEGDLPCPVLKMEHSPSPPPLSPISSDVGKKTDEKPPFLLHHGHEEEAEQIDGNCFMDYIQHEADTATEEEQQSRAPRRNQAEQNQSRNLLQDVMNRFSEKLKTIRPSDNPSQVTLAIDVSSKEQQQSPSQTLQCPGDAHLTEIITKVLHKGSASDYNLSDLFNRHNSTEPKSPNTRSRRRQEVLAAIATPVDDVSARRKILKIKRELAMLDHNSKRNVPPVKRSRLKDRNVITASPTMSDSDPGKEGTGREMMEDVESLENHTISKGQLNVLSAEGGRDEGQGELRAAIITEDVQIPKAGEKQREGSSEEADLTLTGMKMPTHEFQTDYRHSDCEQTQIMTSASSATLSGGQSKEGDQNHEPAPLAQNSVRTNKGKVCHWSERQNDQTNHSKDERRSKRNIVPPQRFSSYVTEPRKMFFVACCADSSFNRRTQNDNILTSAPLDDLSKDSGAVVLQVESGKESSLSSPGDTVNLALEATQCRPSQTKPEDQCELFPAAQRSRDNTDSCNCVAKPCGHLRSSPTRLQVSKAPSVPQNLSSVNVTNTSATCAENPANYLAEYASPIKLMFVSPVKDNKGVRYSLKSAGCGSSEQAEDHFDPCEESSWSGSPEKHSTESAALQVKTISAPLTPASPPIRSARLPTKSAASPSKSVSLPGKSSSSKPKSPSSPAKSGSLRSNFVSSPAKSSTSSSSPVKSTQSPNKSVSSPTKPSTTKSSSSPTKSSTTKSSSSPIKSSTTKSSSSPIKSSTTKSSYSPTKSTMSPSPKPKSPKSASSSPKIGSRKNNETTPTKRVAGTERSPCDFSAFRETTPPKRRPGRPKKLGPQLEQKVKRPIGRPRKPKAVDPIIGSKNVKSVAASDVEENVNKNLKITVVYGRSRRNKRMVSECFDKLQTDFHDAWQAAALKSDLRISMCSSKKESGGTETTSAEELKFVSPVKESATQSSSNIKCHKRDNSVPSRKPGRPAKVKISGISVTVTAVSPRQRKIQINRETQCPETQFAKKTLTPELNSAEDSGTVIPPPMSKKCPTKKGAEDESISQVPNKPVRHSMRVRKPSIHFLHALATSTSRSYSHSNALLRRSKQLLLNKASSERKSSVDPSWGKQQLFGREKTNISDLSNVAGVSVDSIFNPKETLRWWAPSAEEQSMNQELARRIRLISDTWVSDAVENQEKEMTFHSKLDHKSNGSFTRNPKHSSSVVRALFDCPPNKPRSCSMQQLSSWFMETTETQSLAIVKKTSSRNPFELMHFPRSVNKKSVCHSPQAERLRRHIKKFAKTVPKSPLQHQKAQRRLKIRDTTPPAPHIKQQVFSPKQTFQWWRGRTFSNYQATVVRARTRFRNQKEREMWHNKQRKKNNLDATGCSNGPVVNGPQSKHKALHKSAKRKLSEFLDNGSVDQTHRPVDVPKEQNICSKAWSPETLKECRVFLRKINSPDSESAEEEWESCTVTLDDGSPSAYLFAGRDRELVGVVKAVKTEEKNTTRRAASRELVGSEPNSVQGQGDSAVGRHKGKCKSPGVVASEPQPAKMLRQSRMRGLTGPRWCDFVFEN